MPYRRLGTEAPKVGEQIVDVVEVAVPVDSGFQAPFRAIEPVKFEVVRTGLAPIGLDRQHDREVSADTVAAGGHQAYDCGGGKDPRGRDEPPGRRVGRSPVATG